MKKEITIPSVKLNLFVILPYVILIIIGIFAIVQWKSNYEINQKNKELDAKNELLHKSNDSIFKENDKIYLKIKSDSI